MHGISHAGDLSPSFERLLSEIASLRAALLSHPIYDEIDSLERLKYFTEMHVFAVWDFMSLTKRLQRDFTCVTLPWLPPERANAARFVNQVVLDEESDLDLDGNPESHLELYIDAMGEIGADTTGIKSLFGHLREGKPLEMALALVPIPELVRAFVRSTMKCCLEASSVEVAATFLFGREDIIPEMFQKLLTLWPDGELDVPRFAFYLRRHIELDSAEHSPLVCALLQNLAGDDPHLWQMATRAASNAIAERIALWDCVRNEIRSRSPEGALPPHPALVSAMTPAQPDA